MEIKANIIKKLSEKFLPTELEDLEKFTNIKPIDRHRMAMETLRDEFKNGLHAVSFDLKAIED